MAAEATQSLKCNKWVLKVPIHCIGCKRQVKKLLQSIDGVYTTSIDSQNQQVTVTGSIDSEILVKKLSKTGKHAEICAGKPAENAKKTEKQIGQNKEQTSTNIDAKLNSKKANNPESKSPTKKPQEKNADKKGSDNAGAAETGTAGNSGKAKKGKGQKGNCGGDGNEAPASTGLQNANQSKCQGPANPVNLNPTFDQLRPIMPNQGPATVHVMNYNAAYPSKVGFGLSYQIPSSSPYISSYNANEQAESYQVQAATFNTFDIFSDENPNGCSVM